jgi:hypothetical protein
LGSDKICLKKKKKADLTFCVLVIQINLKDIQEEGNIRQNF